MDDRVAFGKVLDTRKARIEGLPKLSGEVNSSFTIPRERVDHFRLSFTPEANPDTHPFLARSARTSSQERVEAGSSGSWE
jgi:hypothetical protein